MKTPYKNIFEVLKLNRFIAISVIIASLLSSIFFGMMTYKMHEKVTGGQFAIGTDGSIIPLKWLSEKENLEVEVLTHLKLFHEYFYGLDANNYEQHIEKALWLGNSSVDNVYRQKKADGVYNRLLQYSLVQKVLSTTSEVNLEKAPYSFRTRTVFEINRGTTIDTYEMITTGKVKKLDKRHFPHNPHGLWITDYFENSLKKLSP